MALPHGATGLSAVCDCGISLSYSLFLNCFYKLFHVQARCGILGVADLCLSPCRVCHVYSIRYLEVGLYSIQTMSIF